MQEYNDILEPVGPPRELNLYLYKFFQAPTHHLDANLIQRYKVNKQFERDLEDQIAQKAEALQGLDQALEKFKAKLLRGYQRLQKHSLKRFTQAAHAQALAYVASKAGKNLVKSLIPQIVMDMKRGLVQVDDSAVSGVTSVFSADIYHNNRILRQQARRVAREQCLDIYKRNQRQLLEEEMKIAEAEILKEMENRTRWTFDEKRRVSEEFEARIAVIKAQKAEEYNLYRQNLAKQLTFPRDVFQKAIPKVYNCEHARTKCWGTIYEKGVKCLQCGAELSSIHLEESQLLGYGTAYDGQLNDVYGRHYHSERTFKFSSSAELAWAEEERIRLEKEKRVLYETDECYFYDFQSIEAIYDFDLRHQKELKAAGVFRQGLVVWRSIRFIN